MIRATNTLNSIARIFCDATKEVLGTSTGKEVTFANTIQKIPLVHLRPEIGCFVLFNGDYSGIMIMNFSANAAMEIYRNQMLHMGLPEEELATEYTADDVVDNIGETINQIIGNVRRKIENIYGLAASNTQPKAIALTTSIILTIDAHDIEKELCRRLSFKIGGHSFHIELSMEKTEFVSLDGRDVNEKAKRPAPEKDQFEAMLAAENAKTNKPEAKVEQNLDFDSLLNATKAEEKENKSVSNDNLDFDALLKQNK
jgi:CheY-specific phosphatase CheX